MVFRKPYAFLIKHFKFIHLVITFLLGIILIQSRDIYQFLKDCISNESYRYNALDFIDYNIYIYIVIYMLLMGVVFWLLRYKDKPRNIYIVGILGYGLIGIFIFVLYSYLGDLVNNGVVQKEIRLYKDILSMLLVYEYYIIIVMALRGIGFDVKKFNFEKDFQELNIVTEDDEEVEVNVGINSESIIRNVRKQKREFGYYFKENKLIISIILVFIAIIVCYNGYKYFDKSLKVYNENDVVGNINFMKVINSYHSEYSGKNYIIVKFNIFKYGESRILNSGIMTLQVGNKKYVPSKNQCDIFSRLGNCYKKQYITSDDKNYILTYEVPEKDIKRAYLYYNESYDIRYKIKLNLQEYEND